MVVWVPQHSSSPSVLTTNHTTTHAAGAHTNRPYAVQASVDQLKPVYTGFTSAGLREAVGGIYVYEVEEGHYVTLLNFKFNFGTNIRF